MPTIRDVAAKAGVHPSTVSRVFSGKAKISAATRDKVLAAAQSLDFQPNAIARSLSVQRTNTIAIVVPHVFSGYFEDAFFPQVMYGLLSAAYANNYRILVSGSDSHEDEITQTFQILGSRQADGIVVVSNRLDVDTVGALLRQETPFVMLGRPRGHHTDISWMDTDNVYYARVAVEHLIDHGHRRIAYVGGDPEVAVTGERCSGYKQAMTAAGLPYGPQWIDYGYFAEDGGYRAVHRMMRLGDLAPTAYYAANDLMAIGIMRALREMAVRVPQDVSVIGTNDSSESIHVYPALSTLSVPYAEMAREAASLLIHVVDSGQRQCVQRLLKCELIIRQSSGPCTALD
jgi:DNA-binding LacI/PurR family transcriptional regulator